MSALKEEHPYLNTNSNSYHRQPCKAKIYQIEDYGVNPYTDEEHTYQRLLLLKKKIAVITISLILAAMVCISFNSFLVSAKQHAVSATYKYYTEIKIEPGDSLWGIASQYMTDEYGSVNDYVKEVMELNSMSSRDLYYGDKIIIPYYSEEIK